MDVTFQESNSQFSNNFEILFQFFLNGPFPASFFFIFIFSMSFLMQLIVNNISDDWIRTTDLWCRKRPLYQLRHNHCPKSYFSVSQPIAFDVIKQSRTTLNMGHVSIDNLCFNLKIFLLPRRCKFSTTFSKLSHQHLPRRLKVCNFVIVSDTWKNWFQVLFFSLNCCKNVKITRKELNKWKDLADKFPNLGKFYTKVFKRFPT